MKRVWLFDLDDTLHDASSASMPGLHRSFGEYIQQHLGLTKDESDALRRRYWLRYGATLLGLVRHHGVNAAHFLHHAHLLPGLEQRVQGHRHDFAAIERLHGRKFIVTNAPAQYTARVLGTLGVASLFNLEALYRALSTAVIDVSSSSNDFCVAATTRPEFQSIYEYVALTVSPAD